jgi:hypothetical protein
MELTGQTLFISFEIVVGGSNIWLMLPPLPLQKKAANIEVHARVVL